MPFSNYFVYSLVTTNPIATSSILENFVHLFVWDHYKGSNHIDPIPSACNWRTLCFFFNNFFSISSNINKNLMERWMLQMFFIPVLSHLKFKHLEQDTTSTVGAQTTSLGSSFHSLRILFERKINISFKTDWSRKSEKWPHISKRSFHIHWKLLKGYIIRLHLFVMWITCTHHFICSRIRQNMCESHNEIHK